MSDTSEREYALYGGTFDPIHMAHIKLADNAVNLLGLEELIFMPAYINPFKQGSTVSSAEDRCAMIEAALSYNPAFSLSDYECTKEGPSYTYETLQYLDGKYEGKLMFVLGMDSLVQVDSWFKGEEILKNYTLITARRPGTADDEAMKKINDFKTQYNADIYMMEMPPMDISATQIRKNVQEGKSIKGLVLPAVEEYIVEHQLYR